MADDSKQVEQLQTRVCVLEALMRQVPQLWVRCRQEGSVDIGLPGSASHEFLKLVYQIEKTVLPTGLPACALHGARCNVAVSEATDNP